MRNYVKSSKSSFGAYIRKKKKVKDLSENTLAPSNIKGLQVNRVNTEIWREMSHVTKTKYLKLQNLQALLLKSVMLTTNVAEQLFCAKSAGSSSVADIAKIAGEDRMRPTENDSTQLYKNGDVSVVITCS